MNERSIFQQALDIPDPDARQRFLDEACHGGQELRQRLDALLQAHQLVSDFLEQPPLDLTSPFTPSPSIPAPVPTLAAGSTFADRFKLREKLGEGGMGTVYVADQLEPVQRRVALKVIKVGRDSRQLLARFEQERQALALMDHPNIAKVYDAGVADGMPYFVMELIKGVPITKYCDDAKLTPRQRLELFVPVCQAVQHAHQKGVIHRDLKPSNVLVALYDGKPIPKVIDFGVAKTTGRQLTDESIYTEVGSLIGTLEYMSPEQAELNNFDIDTRTDVYALGVILYELLTGSVPFSRKELEKAGFAEMLRVIKEVEPPKPSTKLFGSGTLPSIAAVRQTEPAKLTRLVRGELDWIVMKALAKERDRRYETANGFAKDVERFLNEEPVLAGPPTATYRVRKFVRRNQAKVVAAGLVVVAMTCGMVGTTWGLLEARRQEGLARGEANEKEQARLAEARRAEGERLAKQETQKRLEQVDRANEILSSIFVGLNPQEIAQSGRPFQALLVEKLDAAIEQLQGDAIGDPLVVATLQFRLGRSLIPLGEANKAVTLLQRSLTTLRGILGPDDPKTLFAMTELASAHANAGNLKIAVSLQREALERSEARYGPIDEATLTCVNNLAGIYKKLGTLQDAVTLLQEGARRARGHLNPVHELLSAMLNNLADAYQAMGNVDQALPILEEADQLCRRRFGPEHPDTLVGQANLAVTYVNVGRIDEGIALLERTRDSQVRLLGLDHPAPLSTLNYLAGAYSDVGRHVEAADLGELILSARRRRLGVDHPDTIVAFTNLAATWWHAGRLDKSIPLFEEGLRLQELKLGRGHPDVQWTVGNLGVNYLTGGRPRDAIPLLEEVYRSSHEQHELIWLISNLMDAYVQTGRMEEAVKLARNAVNEARAALGTEALDLATVLSGAGRTFAESKLWQEAETVLTEALRIHAKRTPNGAKPFGTQIELGRVFLGQQRYVEAERYLLEGCNGMKQRINKVPVPRRTRLTDAIESLIKLYVATDKPDEAVRWRKELMESQAMVRPAAP